MMRFEIELKPEAQDELSDLSPDVARRITKKIEAMRNDLAGDIKRLVHYTPGWRLRVGDWRVLFEVTGDRVVVWHITHRSKAYE